MITKAWLAMGGGGWWQAPPPRSSSPVPLAWTSCIVLFKDSSNSHCFCPPCVPQKQEVSFPAFGMITIMIQLFVTGVYCRGISKGDILFWSVVGQYNYQYWGRFQSSTHCLRSSPPPFCSCPGHLGLVINTYQVLLVLGNSPCFSLSLSPLSSSGASSYLS